MMKHDDEAQKHTLYDEAQKHTFVLQSLIVGLHSACFMVVHWKIPPPLKG